MSVVAVCVPPGSGGSTTTAVLSAASMPAGHPVVFAECDPSGGDVAAWAQWRESPGWSSAVATGDRSWSGLQTHFQQMPSGLNVVVAPTQAAQAQLVVREAAKRFGPLLRSMSEVTVIADCGRVTSDLPVWVSAADLVLLVVRQAPSSEGATVARVDRAGECLEAFRSARVPVAVVAVGGRPYGPSELSAVLGVEVFAVLPDDASGAALASGAWTVGRGARRSPLARSARPLAALIVEAVSGLGSVAPINRGESSEATG